MIRENDILIDALTEVGHTRFVFAPHIARIACEHYADDIAWMEHRLGESLLESIGSDASAVSGEADLLAIDESHIKAFIAAFERRSGINMSSRLPATIDTSPMLVAETVEICRQAYRENSASADPRKS